jgi:hypothetical protein
MNSSRARLELPLVAAIAALLFYTVASTSVYSISPSSLGLIEVLPLPFWVGLALIGALFYFGRESKYYSAAAFVLLIGYLYATPTLVKEPVWISNSYYPFAEGELITETGHLVPRSLDILTSYHYWPLFLYFSSILTQLTRIPTDMILKGFPLLTIMLYGCFTYLIIRIRLKPSHAILGSAWLLGSFWLRQQYFGPPGIGFIFFLLIIFVLLKLYFSPTHQRGLLLVLVLSFVAITLTHSLTTVMTLAVTGALLLVQLLFQKKSLTILVPILAVYALIVSTYYMLFIPRGFLALMYQNMIESIMQFITKGPLQEGGRVPGSEAQQLSYMSSWAIVGINAAIAGVASVLVLKDVLLKKAKDYHSIFMILFVAVMGVFGLTISYGAHEGYQRAFMFGLAPLTYLSIRLLRSKPQLICIAIVALAFLNVPAQYGSDTFRLANAEQLEGSSFFAIHAPEDAECLTKFSLEIRYYAPDKHFRFFSIGKLPFTSVPNATTVSQQIEEADYVILSDLLNNYYIYYLSVNPFDAVDLTESGRIYDNLGFQVFEPPHSDNMP